MLQILYSNKIYIQLFKHHWNSREKSRAWNCSQYIFTQPLHYDQDVTQGQFLSEIELV